LAEPVASAAGAARLGDVRRQVVDLLVGELVVVRRHHVGARAHGLNDLFV
jgi:hypothetical protein